MSDTTPLHYRVSRRSFLKSFGGALVSKGTSVHPVLEAALKMAGIEDGSLRPDDLVSASDALDGLLWLKTDFVHAGGNVPQGLLASKVHLTMRTLRRVYDYLGTVDASTIHQQLADYNVLEETSSRRLASSIAECILHSAESPPAAIEIAREITEAAVKPAGKASRPMNELLHRASTLAEKNPALAAKIKNLQGECAVRMANEAVSRGFSREKLDDIKFIQEIFEEWETGLKPIDIYSIFSREQNGFARFAGTIVNEQLGKFMMRDVKSNYEMMFSPEFKTLTASYMKTVHAHIAQFLGLASPEELAGFERKPTADELEEGKKFRKQASASIKKARDERAAKEEEDTGRWQSRIYDARGHDPSATEPSHIANRYRGESY